MRRRASPVSSIANGGRAQARWTSPCCSGTRARRVEVEVDQALVVAPVGLADFLGLAEGLDLPIGVAPLVLAHLERQVGQMRFVARPHGGEIFGVAAIECGRAARCRVRVPGWSPPVPSGPGRRSGKGCADGTSPRSQHGSSPGCAAAGPAEGAAVAGILPPIRRAAVLRALPQAGFAQAAVHQGQSVSDVAIYLHQSRVEGRRRRHEVRHRLLVGELMVDDGARAGAEDHRGCIQDQPRLLGRFPGILPHQRPRPLHERLEIVQEDGAVRTVSREERPCCRNTWRAATRTGAGGGCRSPQHWSSWIRYCDGDSGGQAMSGLPISHS